MTTTTTSYDQLPYFSLPLPQTQPNRLATIATLFGMTLPPVPTSRLLEIGCADGSNLIAMGYALPKAQCIGIDFSRRQIEQGQTLLSQLELPNVTLKHKDILEIDSNFGKFDYIIAHGVYSWVSEVVQEKIFEICRQNLAANGVAYISYNTYPGWNMRRVIRDMMLYHTQAFENPTARIEQLKDFWELLPNFLKNQNSLYTAFLQREFEALKELPESYLFHEFLEEVNQPIYFHEFVKRAKQQGLKYLGDTEVETMFNDYTQLENKQLSWVDKEQYADFFTNRLFRQSLLCHHHVRLQREISLEVVKQFYFASPLEPQKNIDIFSKQPQNFRKKGRGNLEENLPIAKSALTYLYKCWPQALKFSELLQQAALQLSTSTAESENSLAKALLNAYLKGQIEAFVYPPRCVTLPGAYPKVSDLARTQLKLGKNSVSNLRCEQLQLHPLLCKIIPFIDGQHDQMSLMNIVHELTKRGIINAQKDGQFVAANAVTPDMLHHFLQEVLTYLARSALLVA
jgi:methyltransferase-like protein